MKRVLSISVKNSPILGIFLTNYNSIFPASPKPGCSALSQSDLLGLKCQQWGIFQPESFCT